MRGGSVKISTAVKNQPASRGGEAEALSVTATAVPPLPKGEARAACCCVWGRYFFSGLTFLAVLRLRRMRAKMPQANPPSTTWKKTEKMRLHL